jgi:septal ring factor EnvC (AmiA/AmiB activator)
MSWRDDARPLVLAAILAAVASHPAHGEIADPAKLESLKQELDTSVERRKSLEAQKESARKETGEIRKKLIDTAARVQASEAEVSASEERLDGLQAAEAVVKARLEHRHAEMVELLAALTRLDRNPPPALTVRPGDALAAVRSAILLGSAVPELRTEADELKSRLEELTRLRESILAERATLAQAKASLERDRANLEALLARKLARERRLAQAVESEEARAERLSREATDLKDLIGKLEIQAATRLPESRPIRRTSLQEPGQAAPAETGGNGNAAFGTENPSGNRTELAALTPPSSLPSSRLFSQAKGLVQLPAAGILVKGFGDPNGLGGKTQGMIVATRPGARVIAPFDGRVVFAGPFRRYGQLLIISVGEGYHVLLAGMERIDGTVGQHILAGEPVGAMGLSDSPDGSEGPGGMAGRSEMPGKRPSLYIEFRKDGDPIDPRPWLLMSDKKARG